MNDKVKFIDLFAGLGGLRIGFEEAFQSKGFDAECVMTSEIKPYAIKTLKQNFSHELFVGDITKIETGSIPDFDFLLAGFPCQPFSAGGKRQGFLDTRGTLFFEIERILRDKKPQGFILENVEGLVKHDLANKNDKIGRTLETILNVLEYELEYRVTWKVFDSIDFGLPQSRKRIFIVGLKNELPEIEGHEPQTKKPLSNIMESGLENMKSGFVERLFKHFSIEELYGKSIKDKRGGKNNIHSWDIGLKGYITKEQTKLLNQLFRERRKKKWAAEIGIDWMDGMPLTSKQISTFSNLPEEKLGEHLEDLTVKGYLRYEHPKKLVIEETANGTKKYRAYDKTKPKGYNIVTGKLSFEINKILDPNDIAPTLVATDVSRLAVPDGNGLRRLTTREGLRLFGFPEWYVIPARTYDAFDLLGNSIAVPIVKFVSERLAMSVLKERKVQFTANTVPVWNS